MAEFSKLIITKNGQKLLAKMIAGTNNVEFTKISTSSTTYTITQLEGLTALSNVQQTSQPARITRTNDVAIKVETSFSNAELKTGYYMRALGLYAKDPDDGEILYAVTIETSGNCYMPAYNGLVVSGAYIQLVTTIGNADNVSLSVDPAAVATIGDIQTLQNQISDLQAFVGYTDSHIYGVEVDFKNKRFTRLAGAYGKTGGHAFDGVHCFGGRRRCNVTDSGKVVAYYGDAAFTTTGALTQSVTIESGPNAGTYAAGTKVQVMVEQPRFYYKVVPLDMEIITEGENHGHHLRKARYYVCDEPETGFKLHPAFIENGHTNDYIYLSAFEGTLYDASAATYILDDAQVADFAADSLCSIANAKPLSGLTQNATRANVRKLAQKRGSGWEQQYAATMACTQMLMLIEYGSFNIQSAIGNGAVSKTDDSKTNMAENTGATVSLGNDSGVVVNANGIQIVSYRGEENLWGNIWKWVDGMNENNPTPFDAAGLYGTLYVADHGFTDNTGDAPYQNTDIHPCYGEGYVSAFGYSEAFDYLFIPTEHNGNTAVPVGDYYWNYNAGWRVASSGGIWNYGAGSGPFCLALDGDSGHRYRSVGGRLVYVPSKKTA